MLKYLRIAVTALSLTACALLIALWVRSYTYLDVLTGNTLGPKPEFLTVATAKGSLTFKWSTEAFPSFSEAEWEVYRLPMDPQLIGADYPQDWLPSMDRDNTSTELLIPFWMLALTISAFGAAPWLHWSKRFSLRTLLIATTRVAVGLGVAVVSM